MVVIVHAWGHGSRASVAVVNARYPCKDYVPVASSLMLLDPQKKTESSCLGALTKSTT